MLVDHNVAAINRRRVLVFALVTWLAIAAALLLPLPHAWSQPWIARLLDRMHTPLMMVGCIACAGFLQRFALSRVTVAGIAAAITIAAAGTAELFQPSFGRTESMQDLGFGMFGAVLGSLWMISRGILQRVVLGVLVLTPPTIWSARAASAFLHAHRSFPVIGEFTGCETGFLWSASRVANDGGDEDLGDRAWSGNSLVLSSSLDSADNARCDARGRDWRGFRAVEFDCELDGTPLELGLRIDGAGPALPPIRLGTTIATGRSHARIVWPEAGARALQSVKTLVLFLAPQPGARHLRISHVVLAP